jgi:hypothetical protein
MSEPPAADGATVLDKPPPESTAPDAPVGPRDAPPSVTRFWSVRRTPAALVALALIAVLGLLLYDVISVRTDRPATAWRGSLAEELAVRRLDDAWVVVTASLLVLLGVWLVILAATPGLRGLLPMRRDTGQLRAGIERHAAAQVLRDRALDVSGVQAVRVVVGRTRVRVTVQAHFRDLEDVRGDLDAVLEHTIDELGLARRPLLSMQVSRPGKD